MSLGTPEMSTTLLVSLDTYRDAGWSAMFSHVWAKLRATLQIIELKEENELDRPFCDIYSGCLRILGQDERQSTMENTRGRCIQHIISMYMQQKIRTESDGKMAGTITLYHLGIGEDLSDDKLTKVDSKTNNCTCDPAIHTLCNFFWLTHNSNDMGETGARIALPTFSVLTHIYVESRHTRVFLLQSVLVKHNTPAHRA